MDRYIYCEIDRYLDIYRPALIDIHGCITVKSVGHDALIAVHDDPSDFFQLRLIYISNLMDSI